MLLPRLYLPVLCILVSQILPGCDDENGLTPETTRTPYSLEFPAYFPEPVALLSNNPLTTEGIQLGERLFFDPLLSGDNALACAGCHVPAKGFADGLALSTLGATGQPLDRHTPALLNLAWADGFFWDGGAKNLESQALSPIIAENEMNQSLPELITELAQAPDYPTYFSAAFDDGLINSANIAKALSQFQRTLISHHTLYDQYRKGQAALTAIQLEGMQLVAQHCGACHPAPLFTDNGYHNNGLDNTYASDHEGIAQGRYRITFDPEDLGKFKVPTLRNTMVSAPYMHDGRFSTLQEVFHHYTHGIQSSATLDVNLPEEGLPLSEAEQDAIVAFLHTLTDDTLMGLY